MIVCEAQLITLCSLGQSSFRDGKPRKLAHHCALRWARKDNEANGIGGNNFAQKWQCYENAWSLLDNFNQ
jgi:hypothetical protein